MIKWFFGLIILLMLFAGVAYWAGDGDLSKGASPEVIFRKILGDDVVDEVTADRQARPDAPAASNNRAPVEPLVEVWDDKTGSYIMVPESEAEKYQ